MYCNNLANFLSNSEMGHVQACITWHYDSYYTIFLFFTLFHLCWGSFGGIFTDVYFYRFTNVFGITLTVTTLKIIFHVMFSSAGGYFGIFWGPFWCEVFYFLRTVQYSFHGIFYRFLKTLWPYFMDWVQLSHGYRATTRRQFTFSLLLLLLLSSQKVLVLVLLRWA